MEINTIKALSIEVQMNNDISILIIEFYIVYMLLCSVIILILYNYCVVPKKSIRDGLRDWSEESDGDI